MRFVTDTHCLVWYFLDDPCLSRTSKALFDRPGALRQIVVPTIVLAEVLYISRKVSVSYSFEKVMGFLEKELRFDLYSLSSAIVKEASEMTQLEMHDALITATARHLDIPLMSCDGEIVDSGFVKTIQP